MMHTKIMNETYKEMVSDLGRSHPHAAERVGFAFVRPSSHSTLVVTGYLPVHDEHYVYDETVGARINHKAIAMAMKRADHQKEGILHVHQHSHRGNPRFSGTDLQSHQDFLRSFRNANQQGIHGFLLLSENRLVTRVWSPGDSIAQNSSKFTIVGLPMRSRWMWRWGL